MGPIPATCGAPAEVTTWMRRMKPWKPRSLVMPSDRWEKRELQVIGFHPEGLNIKEASDTKKSSDIEKFSLKPWFLDSIRSLHWVSEWVFHGLLVKSLVFLGRFTTVQVSSCFTKELEASRRNSLVTFKVGEQHHGAAGHRRRQRLSSALLKIGIETAHGGFLEWGYHSWIVYNGKSMNILQTSMIWGSPILGHLLMDLIWFTKRWI